MHIWEAEKVSFNTSDKIRAERAQSQTKISEPECYDKKCQVHDVSKWELTMKDEMKSLTSTKTWKLAELLVEKKTLHKKWVYRVNQENSGSRKYKERWVVKGFQQK